MKYEISHAKIRLILGVVSLGIGLITANLALFQWAEQTGLYRLFGDYSRYVCAYGGFGAMIFGALLINDFFFLMSTKKRELAHARALTRYRRSQAIHINVREPEEQVVANNTRRNQKRSQ
jgi:hypothetical protein